MLGRHDRNSNLRQRARRMRTQSTDAERKLWSFLRNRQLVGFRFRRQHPVGGYIVDFVCLEANLVVELDGGQHSEESQSAHDAQRTIELQKLNLRVLRFTDYEMLKNAEAVLLAIHRALIGDRPSP
jgi:very-short-patch-repair endonuclease